MQIACTISKTKIVYTKKRKEMKSALEIKPDISYKSAGKFEETRFEKNQAKRSIIHLFLLSGG